VAIAFNWANGSIGQFSAGIEDDHCTIGVTNKIGDNGTFTEGELIIAVLNLSGVAGADPGEPTVPGFTTLLGAYMPDPFGKDIRVWAGYKVAGSGESGAYAASWTETTFVTWALLNFSGVDQSNPIDVSSIAHDNTSPGSEHRVPSVTPNFEDDYWLAVECRRGGNSPDTPSAPLVGLFDNLSNDLPCPEISIAGVQLTTSDPTGQGLFTQAAFGESCLGLSVGLRTFVPTSEAGRGSKRAVHVTQHAGDFRHYLDKQRAEHRKSSEEAAKTARAIELAGQIRADLKQRNTDTTELQRKSEALEEIVGSTVFIKDAMADLSDAIASLGQKYAKAQRLKALEAAEEIERQLLDDEDAIIALLLS
jgi:hypothetical protein